MDALFGDDVKGFIDRSLKGWTFDNNTIRREFRFRNFVEAFSFMTAVGMEAEKIDHHPDWSNTFNRVTITLSTHSAGGVTNKDFDLAGKIDAVYNNYIRS